LSENNLRHLNHRTACILRFWLDVLKQIFDFYRTKIISRVNNGTAQTIHAHN